MDNKYSITDKYFILWAFFIPISSWVISPSIKGSLISYLFAFLSPLVIICFRQDILKKYILDLTKIVFVLLFFALMSQLANVLFNINLYNIVLVNPGDFDDKIFRSSLITQSIYLLPPILTFLYIKYLYKSSWDKWIIYGGLIFVLYGFYKWITFLLFGIDMDFLTNRTFGDLDSSMKFQLVNVAGIMIQRFQSLSGEPSMYAFTILPYFIFAIHHRANIFIIAMIGLSILLSTSTTAYLGISIYMIYILIYSKKGKTFFKVLVGLIIIFCIVYGIFSEYINDVYQQMLLNKIDSQSGEIRSYNSLNHISYLFELDYMHILFGIGFGYIRSEDLFSTLLVNTGVLGLFIFTCFYLKDFCVRVKSFKVLGYNAILLVSFITSMMAVSEFSYLSFWIFLAIIRNENNYIKDRK
ncbi:hypothetical protein [Megamonas hypermegale]|uniref:hypothetical protein n=1 Tax=Megamonas hypermegale TaxID=158847 RepID=UPI00242ACE3E|nr:hypothetical protein [Megamonas hypermegale]